VSIDYNRLRTRREREIAMNLVSPWNDEHSKSLRSTMVGLNRLQYRSNRS